MCRWLASSRAQPPKTVISSIRCDASSHPSNCGRVFERIVLAQVASFAYHHEVYTGGGVPSKLEKLYSYLATAGEDTRLFWQANAPQPPSLPAQSSSESNGDPAEALRDLSDVPAVPPATDTKDPRTDERVTWC